MNKIKEIVNTRTKKIIVGAVGIIIVIGCGSIVYLMTKDTTPTLKVKKSSITIEYGDSVSLDSKEYVDIKKIVKEEQERFIKEVKIESDIKNEEGKEYPAIGKYEITLKHEKQIAKVKVEVKDTAKPTFNEVNEVSFEEGTEYDYAANITATDLQEVEVTFDTSGVNKDVLGEYIVKATAKDKSGNEESKDVKVIVTAKPVVEAPKQETPASNTTTNNSANSTSNNASKPTTSAGGQTSTPSTQTPVAPAPAPEKPAVPAPQPEPAKPKFVLPADTNEWKFFKTEAEQFAYIESIKGKVAGYTFSNDYDWKTDTYYYWVHLK